MKRESTRIVQRSLVAGPGREEVHDRRWSLKQQGQEASHRKGREKPQTGPPGYRTGVCGEQNVRASSTGPWRPRGQGRPKVTAGGQGLWTGGLELVNPAFFADSIPVLFSLFLGLLTCSTQCRAPGFGGNWCWQLLGQVSERLCSLLQAARGWGHPGRLTACCVTLGKSLSIFGLCPGAMDLFSPSDTEATVSQTRYFERWGN